MTQSNTTSLQTALNYISDSQEGYLKASETVERGSFRQAFAARAAERGSMIKMIDAAIRENGGEPETGGTTIGAVHRNLISVVSLVQNDEKAAVKMIDDGEERLREKIADILEDGELSPRDKIMLEAIKRELEADAQILERMEEAVD